MPPARRVSAARSISFAADTDGCTGRHGCLVHLYQIFAEHGKMTHLAPRSGVLAVQVQLEVGHR